MTPIDHEAAKKWAEETWNTLRNIVLDDVTEADAIEYRNAARAYLDLAAREAEAAELLGRLCDVDMASVNEHSFAAAATDVAMDARAFLTKRKENYVAQEH